MFSQIVCFVQFCSVYFSYFEICWLGSAHKTRPLDATEATVGDDTKIVDYQTVVYVVGVGSEGPIVPGDGLTEIASHVAHETVRCRYIFPGDFQCYANRYASRTTANKPVKHGKMAFSSPFLGFFFDGWPGWPWLAIWLG